MLLMVSKSSTGLLVLVLGILVGDMVSLGTHSSIGASLLKEGK